MLGYIYIYIYIYIVLQIRDYFQLVGQWAERLKGILSPKVVQERCIFLLPRSTKNAENWFYEYNVQEVNSTKILSKYTFTHKLLIMLSHFKKSASILTDQETQMVGNDRWPVTICNIQGFPQVLRTWAALPNLMVGLSHYMRGAWGSLKCCWKIPMMEFIW